MERNATVLTSENDRAEAGRIQRLRCAVKGYDWGRTGSDSLVAGLHEANSGSCVDPDRPYAELWMGTHESGPSLVAAQRIDAPPHASEGVTLKSWILENPYVLGSRVLDKWGCDLPFLFKVLSVAKPLSIQAHPNKELAQVLHKEHPDLYKDDNHKPEMALAITEFEALCGFIPLEELKNVLGSVPEIKELVQTADCDQIFQNSEHDGDETVKSILRSIFMQLMSADSDTTKNAISKMKNRLNAEIKERQLTEKERLVLRLENQYPGDIGVISAYFFNYVMLNPGEALYIDANEPHAYLSGECIECMATSDNVVRAGLTPKHRDIETLCSMLTYKTGYPEILKGFPLSPYITRYLPPFDEFEVDRCVLPPGATTVLPAVPGPSVFLVMDGEGYMLTGLSHVSVNRGDVLFAPANTEIWLTGEIGMKLYRASVSSRFFQTL